jgi:hypothetical protein
LISPFVGRILDWYKAKYNKQLSWVNKILWIVINCCYIIMMIISFMFIAGASFRTNDEIIALADCVDRFWWICPPLVILRMIYMIVNDCELCNQKRSCRIWRLLRALDAYSSFRLIVIHYKLIICCKNSQQIILYRIQMILAWQRNAILH